MKNLIILSFFLVFISDVGAQDLKGEVREITVTSEIRSWTGVKSARVTITLEQVASNATEAYSALLAKETKISNALSKINISSPLINRGEKIHTTTDSQQRILPTTNQVKITRNIGFEIKDIGLLGKAIDAANANGAQFVNDIEYISPNESDSDFLALNSATEKARSKAEVIARALGVKLGRVMNVTVTEEPAGSQLQQQIVRGGNSLDFTDRTQQIYVNVVYEIFGGESQKILDEKLNKLMEKN